MAHSPGNLHEYSVSEISGALKRTVEEQFSYVRVRGELSGTKLHSSGHLYLSLKDERAAIDGVCWRGNAGRLAFKPEDGLEVIATGKLSTYPARSKYQLVIEHMEPAGAGALMALFEERKRRLAAEGLFAAERKRPIPYLPETIAVVTSPTGAVIRDILHRLQDRFPRRVLLWPVAVQGEGAGGQIAAAIAGINRLAGDDHDIGAIPRPDVMIVARGGGSIEDLWAFNEEEVARAAANSAIPLISAVGHETDTTLIDFVADRRAPTPTAAAEIAVPVHAELEVRVADLARRKLAARRRYYDRLRDRLAGLSRGLPRPRDVLNLARQRLDEMSERLPRALMATARDRRGALSRLEGSLRSERLVQLIRFRRREAGDAARRLQPAAKRVLTEARRRFEADARLLETMSYRSVLKRGYAVLRDEGGSPVTRVAALKAGAAVEAEMRDGRARLVVAGAPAPAGKKPSRKKNEDARQQSLL